MSNFFLRIFCGFVLITVIQTFFIRKQIESLQNSTLLSLDSKKLEEMGKKNNRILTNASSPFQINYVIPTFLKNYSDRTAFCNYLCQPASITAFFSSQSCYLSYNCPSIVFENVLIIIGTILYGIMPLFMILFGVWTFKCWNDNIAIITGVILINSIYSKFSQQFHDDMQTDYDISTSQQATSSKESQSG